MSDGAPKPIEIPRLRPRENAPGRWGRMARRLGLLAVAREGLFGTRTRMLVGERGGYLVAVSPSHTLNASSVDILVRFPQGHTVRGFGDDLRRRVGRRRRKHLFVGDGSVLQRMPYAVFPPTLGAVARATDGLVEAMRDRVGPLERRCEGCGIGHDLGLYVAEGVPGIYCERCVDAFVRGEREFAETVRGLRADYARGLSVGVAAAAAFGLALGAFASLAIVYGGRRSSLFAAPVFAAIGYLASAVASRGLLSRSVLGTVAKLPIALLGAAVGMTAMNAVATMTLHPAEWNPTLVVWSLVGPFRVAPRSVALFAGAAALGWLLESALALVVRPGRAPRTRVERIEGSASPQP